MKRCKSGITIALFCCLISNPAKAFFPVCDFCELPTGVIPQITLSMQNLSEMKDQISQMTENLRAIGDVRETIASFSESLYNEAVSTATEAAEQAIDMAFATNTSVQSNIVAVAENVNNIHKSIINTMVSQVEEKIEVAQAETPEYMKLALNEQNISYIEEDEEEITDTDKEKENLQKYFSAIKEESSQLYVKMNDLFDSSINVMNRSSDLSNEALSTLKQTIDDSKEITDEEKKQLHERTTELLNKNQENSDVMISLMEDIQNNHSKQYQEKIAENINNYQKMVQAYVEGSITADELLVVGNNIKTEAENLNILSDNKIFASYNEKSADIQVSTKELMKDIKQIWENKEDNS